MNFVSLLYLAALDCKHSIYISSPKSSSGSGENSRLDELSNSSPHVSESTSAHGGYSYKWSSSKGAEGVVTGVAIPGLLVSDFS